MKKIFESFSDANLEGLCFRRLVFMLQEKLASEAIIPIMDGFNPPMVEKLSSYIKTLDVIRATNLWEEKDLSIKHSENILGEVFYADSKFAIFMQAVDMLSYLRLVTDLSQQGKKLSVFKQRLLKTSERLTPIMTRERIATFQIQSNI